MAEQRMADAGTMQVPLNAAGEEFVALADFWRQRALMRAMQVDALKGELGTAREQLAQGAATLEALAPTAEKAD